MTQEQIDYYNRPGITKEQEKRIYDTPTFCLYGVKPNNAPLIASSIRPTERSCEKEFVEKVGDEVWNALRADGARIVTLSLQVVSYTCWSSKDGD